MPVRSPPARSLPLLLATLAWAIPAHAAAVPVPPAATPFRLGGMKLVALADMTNVVPNDGSVFGLGVDPKTVADSLARAGAPTDRITLGVDALLVVTQGRMILIDTGLGPKVGGVLPKSLALAGVTPDQITDVLITHSHPDHVGGLLRPDGALAFPNAAIHMSAPEWLTMRTHGDQRLVAAIHDKVDPFEPGATVVPGIRSVALPGHTPGHSGYEIGSGDERLLDIGDTAHSTIVSLAKPDWAIRYDGDAARGRATRKAELARLAASHERIFAPHFPYPGVGFIVKSGAGYRFEPALP